MNVILFYTAFLPKNFKCHRHKLMHTYNPLARMFMSTGIGIKYKLKLCIKSCQWLQSPDHKWLLNIQKQSSERKREKSRVGIGSQFFISSRKRRRRKEKGSQSVSKVLLTDKELYRHNNLFFFQWKNSLVFELQNY